MPSIVLEYTSSVEEKVNIQGLLDSIHQVALECGLFHAADVKSRALRCHQWLIGEYDDSEDFIHITLELLSGRSTDQKKDLSKGLIAVLSEHAGMIKSLSVNIRDMDREIFQKVVN
ncbi:5-carboxymethyl-2-hydroxymuconate Delta-isomerase [Vibrio sp. MA40-2]|uniref:5-carboxymethyl-2-hydroxymuconate Delta-isomerase n=1 Tax=Vibrio sp. MA40-2 TaxID=3391828 RepID=UPI0039A442F5